MINLTAIGRLGKDPEMKYFESGKVVASFSIANKEWDSKAKENKTSWYNVEVWDKQAEIIGEYVKQGHKIAVSGELYTQKWQDNEGNEKSKVVIKANKVELQEKKES